VFAVVVVGISFLPVRKKNSVRRERGWRAYKKFLRDHGRSYVKQEKK